MDRPITATEANQRFSKMLRDVQGGESFVVTSRGEPVARVIPIEKGLETQRKRSEALLAFLEKQPRLLVGPWTRDDLYD